jgi:hypothetical protein
MFHPKARLENILRISFEDASIDRKYWALRYINTLFIEVEKHISNCIHFKIQQIFPMSNNYAPPFVFQIKCRLYTIGKINKEKKRNSAQKNHLLSKQHDKKMFRVSVSKLSMYCCNNKWSKFVFVQTTCEKVESLWFLLEGFNIELSNLTCMQIRAKKA